MQDAVSNTPPLFLYSYYCFDDSLRIGRREPDIPVAAPATPCDDPDLSEFSGLIDQAYEEVVHWRKNIFEVPTCAVGRSFVQELSKWLEHFNAKSRCQTFAMKTFIVLPALLLQKPSAKSKRHEHKALLEKRLEQWNRKEILELLRSGRTIQKRRVSGQNTKKEDTARKFANLMFEGKVTHAVRMLTDEENQGVLPLTEETLAQLKEKHPTPAGIREETLLNGPIRQMDSSYFDCIDGNMIARATKKTNGSAGPSTTDADFFQHILLHKNFKGAGQSLREELARFSRLVATEFIDPQIIQPYLNSRLIPLNKCPGVRPIGVGETVRRIVGKAIAWTLKSDIQKTAGPLQVCTGIKSGSEAAVHFVREQFEADTAEACILVDTSNAFNAVNRQVMLHNLLRQCPEFAPVAVNMYRCQSRLFVSGSEIVSSEGTTQGDNLAMSLFALATLPILQKLEQQDLAHQVWLADDATAVGTIERLRSWWDLIVREGLKYGYYVNAGKSCLIVKRREDFPQASMVFASTGIKISSDGQRHLGAVIGSAEFRKEYIDNLVAEWSGMLTTLSSFAKSQPHAAFCAFTHGVRHKFTYFMRTIEGLGESVQQLDKLIDDEFIPALFGCKITPLERKVVGLPARFGGLGIPNLAQLADEEYRASLIATQKVVADMKGAVEEMSSDILKEIQKSKEIRYQSEYQTLVTEGGVNFERILGQAREGGTSNWLTVLPLAKYRFNLHKGDFRDSILMRYGKDLPRLPSSCVCGEPMTMNHALNCPRGGYIIVRHNHVRDFLAGQLSQVYKDVEIEPQLQPLEGETFGRLGTLTGEQPRPDIRARGFYREGQNAFFDIKLMNPNADSYQTIPTRRVYERAEQAKRRSYNERILNVEQGTFCPLIFSVTGGSGLEAKTFLKILSGRIADKTNQDYSCVMNFMKCKMAFMIRRLVLLCVRGSRSTPKFKDISENCVSDFEFACFASKL